MRTTGEQRAVASRHLRAVFGAGTIGMLSDGRLLERFLDGRGDDDSAAAFEALVQRHGPMVLAVCRDALGNDLHDAEDAAQATFLILARQARSIRRADSIASWLFGVARKVAARSRARASRRRAAERKGAEVKARAAAGDPTPSAVSELHDALARLPEHLRAPIVLCHLEGLTNEQAAGRLRLPLRTVQRRLRQGRDRLKDRLVRRGVAPAFGAGWRAIDSAAGAASGSWIEATVRAAAGLSAGRAAGAVAPATVVVLMKGAMTPMLAGRLRALAAACVVAGSVVTAVAGAGGLPAARPQDRPVETKSGGARSATPPVAPLGPWIKGIVVDERGNPVAGARVSPLWPEAPQPVITDADGAFALPTDVPRPFERSILATADGGARQAIFRLGGPSGYHRPRALARVVLRPAREVAVSVVDAGGGPVRDAAVIALDRYFAVVERRTDERGAVVLRVPADANMQWIVGYKPGVGLDYFVRDPTDAISPFLRPPRRARLVLDGARTVRIRAVDSAGRPVPGVELAPLSIHKRGKLDPLALSAAPVINARTDANGVATFDCLPASLLDRTSLQAVSPSHSLIGSPLLDPEAPDVELTARVLRLARVSGTVTHPDGSPAPGILVEATNAIGLAAPSAETRRARTGADGSYAMDLRPDRSYLIAVVDDEWAARSLGGVVVREGVPRAGLDLTLERGAVIRGRVTTETDPEAGERPVPLPGKAIRLVERGPDVPPGTFRDQPHVLVTPFTRVAYTDDDGRYAFRVAPGAYSLIGLDDAYYDALLGPHQGQEINVVAGQEVKADFEAAEEEEPSHRTVRGVVRAGKSDGPPVADAIVIVQPTRVDQRGAQPWKPAEWKPRTYGDADERGRFELSYPSGNAVIYARNPDGSLAGYAVLDDADHNEIIVVVVPAATASGRVVDEEGKPWASVNASYCLTLFLGNNAGYATLGQVVVTDADGRFTAPGIPAGLRCDFNAYSPDRSKNPTCHAEAKDARPFEVPPLVIDRPRASPDGAGVH